MEVAAVRGACGQPASCAGGRRERPTEVTTKRQTLTMLIAAYTLLCRRPPCVEVYALRRSYAQLEPWLLEAWRRSEDDVHTTVGLDDIVFIRIFVFRSPRPPKSPYCPSMLFFPN